MKIIQIVEILLFVIKVLNYTRIDDSPLHNIAITHRFHIKYSGYNDKRIYIRIHVCVCLSV